MEYTYKESPMSIKYQNIYIKAREKNEQVKCYTGIEKEYRMINRESYYDNITDTEILLENCLYPIFNQEGGKVLLEINRIIDQMIDSDDVIQIFQVFNLIISQEIEMRLYSNLPFIIDFSDKLDRLFTKKSKLEYDLKTYKEYGFDMFKESIWEVIERICRKSQLLQQGSNK